MPDGQLYFLLNFRTYPSEVRRFYYSYYMAYFQPSGLIYAKDERESARTG